MKFNHTLYVIELCIHKNNLTGKGVIMSNSIYIGRYFQFTKSLFFIALVLVVTACNEQQSGVEALQQVIDNPNQKVYLDKASTDQVALFTGNCQGNKRCVQICHRPPGNPDNSKTMILPLEATEAHLNHGGNHADDDYLGACTNEEEDPSTPPSDNGSGNGHNPHDIPEWCRPNLHIDKDCDGIDDHTGDPLF
jgi:hypothetical protein